MSGAKDDARPEGLRPEVVRCPACRHPTHSGEKCSAMVCATSLERVPGLGQVTTVDSRRCPCTYGREAKPC